MTGAASRVIAVVGATATGKTGLAEALADSLRAEIVCADSRQVFRELEIGTGKPTPAQRAERPHHLFDALSIGQRASAGWFGRAAREACTAIASRGATPLLVGGSGLYLEAARHGLAAEPPHDPEIRARLRAEAAAAGGGSLHRRLAAVDPDTAGRLPVADLQRVTRALEVYEASGRPLSWWHREGRGASVEGDWTVLEITCAPRLLALRIARRTREMFDAGLVDETRRLVERGGQVALRALRAVGYDEALELLAGRITRAEAEERTSTRTRQLAKRQRTWFRHRVEALRLDGGEAGPDALVRTALERLRS